MPGPKPKPRETKICPVCNNQFQTRWSRQVCCSKSCARKLDAQRYGPSGWKGGTSKHGAGYIKELAKDHPHADKGGYVMQHRLVMERVIGRYLDPKERVHHKNGVRSDNRPENLELWSVDHKDPAGIRLSDQLRHLWDRLSPEERRAFLEEAKV